MIAALSDFGLVHVGNLSGTEAVAGDRYRFRDQSQCGLREGMVALEAMGLATGEVETAATD